MLAERPVELRRKLSMASFRSIMTMRMPSTRFIALVVLVVVVLLMIAEFGPAVLSGK